MKRKEPKKDKKSSSKPEKITSEDALERMKKFSERKEKIIAAINESKN